MATEKRAKEYTFTAWGHPNIRATHPTTLMFTKDAECTLRGDCIVGVRADFDANELKKCLFATKLKISMHIQDEDDKVYQEDIVGFANPTFNDSYEIVMRKSKFIDKRTIAFFADRAAVDLLPEFKLALLKRIQMRVTIAACGK